MFSVKALPRLGWRPVIPAVGLIVVLFILFQGYPHFSPAASVGTLHPPSGPHVELVVASLKGDDTSWLPEYLPQWKANVYIVNDQSANLTVPKNKGREGMVYLTHIIDHYDKLPDILVFIHSLRYQWHNDDPLYDGVPLLQALQTSHILSQGYVNLRCVWTLGCPSELRPYEENRRPPTDQAGITQEAYPDAFAALFPGERVPEIVGVACCAQFAVTKETIRQRPLDDYRRYREWLLTTELQDSISGRVMEYSWHQIFGKPSVHCPDAKGCYCQTYGLCNLTCPTTDRCGERWHFPPSATLPQGWPETGWKGEHRTAEELAAARYEAMEFPTAASSTA